MATAPIGIMVAYDKDARRLVLNPVASRMLEVPMARGAAETHPGVDGFNFSVFRHGEQLSGLSDPLRRAASQDREIRDEILQIRFHDGRTISLSVNASPLISAGRVRGAVAALVDVTEREEHERILEERVREATDSLRATRDRLRASLKELAATEDRERGRLADDLHDYLGQLMAAAQLELAALEKASATDAAAGRARLADIIQKANDYSRTLLTTLHPAALNDGLMPALVALRHELLQHGLEVRLEGAVSAVPEPTRRVVYRAIRELLSNVARHACVRTARVQILRDGDQLHIAVSDEGRGFDVTRTDGYGLRSVRERVTSLGGRVEVNSAAGAGTTVGIWAPVD